MSQEEIFMNVGSHSTVLTGLLAVRDLSTGACQLCAMSYNIDIQQMRHVQQLTHCRSCQIFWQALQ